jgi:bifunctional non-homologous end joining protein LigD
MHGVATKQTAGPLSEYEAKRDFAETPEPPAAVDPTDRARFVVQEHHASHLHWDFRLEMHGVLKSWAVPKGPPEEQGLRRLAVQVEDHPVGYIDFEGTIPSGYGAGTVKIWDAGQFELESGAASKLVFRLHGRRLDGRYSLVRTAGKNWILQKSAPEPD